jgi:hypothetical protein
VLRSRNRSTGSCGGDDVVAGLDLNGAVARAVFPDLRIHQPGLALPLPREWTMALSGCRVVGRACGLRSPAFCGT